MFLIQKEGGDFFREPALSKQDFMYFSYNFYIKTFLEVDLFFEDRIGTFHVHFRLLAESCTIRFQNPGGRVSCATSANALDIGDVYNYALSFKFSGERQ